MKKEIEDNWTKTINDLLDGFDNAYKYYNKNEKRVKKVS